MIIYIMSTDVLVFNEVSVSYILFSSLGDPTTPPINIFFMKNENKMPYVINKMFVKQNKTYRSWI